MPDKLDQAWKINSYLSQYIQIADAKASGIIAACTLNATLLPFLPQNLQMWQSIVILVCASPLLASVVFATICLMPRLDSPAPSKTIFWQSIVEHSSWHKYREALIALDDTDEVIAQNYNLAKIATKKYYWLQYGIRCLAIGLILSWISVFYLRVLLTLKLP
jgi:hypothetical protein